MNTELLTQATAFIWKEADMLDHAEYDAWLALWDPEGLYVVPIDPNETDFANTLNYAYDNHAMRQKRITRLTSGESISTVPAPRTVRSVSRVRVLKAGGDNVVVRCAQDLREFRKTRMAQHTADVTFTLRRAGSDFLIESKVVRLLNSTDVLTSIGFIL